jgi:hypothetical protein
MAYLDCRHHSINPPHHHNQQPSNPTLESIIHFLRKNFFSHVSGYFFFLLRSGVRAASNSAYSGYPELWILRYPAHRYHAVPLQGFEPTSLWLRVRRPNHSATTLHNGDYYMMDSLALGKLNIKGMLVLIKYLLHTETIDTGLEPFLMNTCHLLHREWYSPVPQRRDTGINHFLIVPQKWDTGCTCKG